MNKMKIIIDKFYEDVEAVYFVDDSFDITKLEEYGKDFAEKYNYETRIEHGHLYIKIDNYKLYGTLDNLWEYCEDFRGYLRERFNFISQEFYLI